MQMQYLSDAFLLGPDKKDSNGSQLQKTPTSTKIYTILQGTFNANIQV